MHDIYIYLHVLWKIQYIAIVINSIIQVANRPGAVQAAFGQLFLATIQPCQCAATFGGTPWGAKLQRPAGRQGVELATNQTPSKFMIKTSWILNSWRSLSIFELFMIICKSSPQEIFCTEHTRKNWTGCPGGRAGEVLGWTTVRVEGFRAGGVTQKNDVTGLGRRSLKEIPPKDSGEDRVQTVWNGEWFKSFFFSWINKTVYTVGILFGASCESDGASACPSESFKLWFQVLLPNPQPWQDRRITLPFIQSSNCWFPPFCAYDICRASPTGWGVPGCHREADLDAGGLPRLDPVILRHFDVRIILPNAHNSQLLPCIHIVYRHMCCTTACLCTCKCVHAFTKLLRIFYTHYHSLYRSLCKHTVGALADVTGCWDVRTGCASGLFLEYCPKSGWRARDDADAWHVDFLGCLLVSPVCVQAPIFF